MLRAGSYIWNGHKMCMLFGLLVVVPFESTKIPTVDWIRGKIAIICSRTTYVILYKAYMHRSKKRVEQCLETLLFMLMTRLVFAKLAYSHALMSKIQ